MEELLRSAGYKEMKAMPPRTSFRRANKEDYERIMEISKGLFEGFDYMPAKYHSYLRNPDYFMFVAEYEGNLVSLIAFWRTDGGRSLLGTGARTDPQCRQKGIFSHLRNHAMREVLRLLPGVERMRGAPDNSEILIESLARARSENPRQIIHAVNLVSTIPMDYSQLIQKTKTFKEIDVLSKTVEAEKINKDELHILLDSDSESNGIFENGIIFYDFKPFEASLVNIDHLLQPEIICFKTSSTENCVNSASIVMMLQRPKGFNIRMELHGDINKNTVSSHICSAMQAAPDFYQTGAVTFTIIIPREKFSTEVQNTLMSLLPCNKFDPDKVSYVTNIDISKLRSSI